MSQLRRFEACSFVLLAALAAGCSDENSGTLKDVAYSGTAYPNRRPLIEADGHLLGFVPSLASDAISVVDLDEMSVVTTVPIGRDPVDVDGPKHLLLDPSAGLAYVALSYPFSRPGAHERVAGATLRSGYAEALDLSDLSVVGDARLDPNTYEVALSSHGVLASTHYDADNAAITTDPDARRSNLVLVDPASSIEGGQASPRRVSLPAASGALAFNADGSRLFVACTGIDSLLVIDTATGEMVGQAPTGMSPANKPISLVADVARERVLVSNEVASTVAVFDMADTPNALASLYVGAQPMFPTWLSDSVIAVPYQQPNGVALFDETTSELLLDVRYTEAECRDPSELTLTADGRLLLVCQGSQFSPGWLVELDPETLAIKSRVDVGIYPERLTILAP